MKLNILYVNLKNNLKGNNLYLKVSYTFMSLSILEKF